jgi:cell wall-associated NlpC family hydrolase
MRTTISSLAVLLACCSTAHADCSSEVNDAFAKLRTMPAFSMQTKITNEQGTLDMNNDYVLPDRMHQRVSLSSGGAGTMEMILIGSKAWSNQGQGWVPLPQEFTDKIKAQMKETVVDPPKETTTYTCLGDVQFEGKTYAGYQAKRAAPAAAPAPDTGKAEAPAAQAAPAAPAAENVQTVYIDKTTGVPARNIVTPAQDPNKRLFDGTFSLKQDLKIEEPKS